MGYASKQGRARISSTNPQAAACCDRCGRIWNHVDLSWQFDYAGAGLINKRILVCNPCYDTPQEQLRAIVLPADPVPINQPRVQDFTMEQTIRGISGYDSTDPHTGIPVPGTIERVTQTNALRTTQQTGEAPGGKNTLPGTDPNAPGDSNPGIPPDNASVPSTGPLK